MGDPVVPDQSVPRPPGQTVRPRGRLSFYEGDDIQAEFCRIESTGWRAAAAAAAAKRD